LLHFKDNGRNCCFFSYYISQYQVKENSIFENSSGLKTSFVSILLQQIVTALFDFAAHEEGEVSFSRGDRVTVLDTTNENWWEGNVNGKVGLFPANYVSKP
jgi:hypothetical protein